MFVSISQKRAWQPLNYFTSMKSKYFREYLCSFSSKSYYFYILGVSHLKRAIGSVTHVYGHSVPFTLHNYCMWTAGNMGKRAVYWISNSFINILKTLTYWGRVAYMCQQNIPPLLQIMACRLFDAKPLSEPMLPYGQPDPEEHISVQFYLKFKSLHSRKSAWKYRLRNGGHFVSTSIC